MTEDYFNYFCANRRAINEAIRNEKSIITNGGGGESGPKGNELWYTTSNELIITLYGTTGLPKIISHKYKDGKGIIKFAGDITKLADYMFNGSDSYLMTSITMPNSITSIGVYAFSGCSGLTAVTIGNRVTTIENSAFNLCSSLPSINIPDSVTSIENGAFNGCSNLTSVTIGNSVTSIGAWAFATCRKLTSVTIPNSVTSIGMGAFNLCYGLTSVTCEATTPPTLGTNAFHYVPSNIPLYVPKGTVSAYEATDWSYFTNIFEIGTVAYTITWKNWDGSTLSQKMVAAGTVPEYTGETPVKPDDATHVYDFEGWTPNIAKIYSDTTYTAVFTTVTLPEWVDLGLPSGTLWPLVSGDGGKYYAWGELETKNSYDSTNYKYGESPYTKYNTTDGKVNLDPEDDVLYQKYHGKARMATKDDIDELIANVTVLKNGEGGYTWLVSKNNSNKIRMNFTSTYYSGSSTPPFWGSSWCQTATRDSNVGQMFVLEYSSNGSGSISRTTGYRTCGYISVAVCKPS